MFGHRDLIRALGYLAVVIVLFLVVFTNQVTVLELLDGSGSTMQRLIVAFAVFLIVPIVAWSYGSVTRALMKLIKME
jgi:hypothetical protein